MAKRTDLLDQFIEEVGHDVVSILERRDGWPSIVQLHLQSESLLLALHIGGVQKSGRGRDDVERRIQNPTKGRSLSGPSGAYPVVIGVWTEEGDHVLVGMDAELRMSRTTRQSMFMPLLLLQQASSSGWAEHTNTTGEIIVGFRPALLPAYVEMRRSNLRLLSEEVGRTFEASGLLLPDNQSQRGRERRVSMALARSARFSRVVIDAYGGVCAMCGLGLGLVEGAHIYPVMAPDAPDQVWNGLALCGNHHGAFDRHLIWVEPDSLAVEMHPALLKGGHLSPASRMFVDLTYSELRRPSKSENCPRRDMFEARYQFFSGAYAWSTRRLMI